MNKFLGLLVFCAFVGSQDLCADLHRNQLITVNDLARSYDLYIPTRESNTPRPLVLLLHGHGGDADYMSGYSGKITPYKKWQRIADRENWVLAIPDGIIGPDNYRGWNDCRKDSAVNPKTDDVEFLNKLVNKLVAEHSLDQDRVYAHGTSNGGNMVLRLALESSDKFKAVAAIVAAMPADNKCRTPSSPISVLIMNGTKDPLVPYQGGKIGFKRDSEFERGTVMSTQKSIDYWVKHNRITEKPVHSRLKNINRRDRSRVTLSQYFNTDNNTEVALYKVTGGGHTEPSLKEHYRGMYKLLVGRQNKDFEMAEAVWEFFERHP